MIDVLSTQFSMNRAGIHHTIRLALLVVFKIWAGVSYADTLVFATSYDDRTHQTINHRVFAQDVTRASANQLQFELYTNGELSSGMALFQAVSAGELDLGEVILSSLEPLNPVFLVDNLPFVVSDFEEAFELWQRKQAQIERIMEDHGVMLLYTVPWPPQGLYTTGVIRSLEDLNGLNIRSYSAMTQAVIEAMEANPVDVPFANVADAFSRGEIDAMITSVTTGISSSAWQYTGVYTKVVLWIPKNVVFMNRNRFEQLSPTQQAAILSFSEVAESRGWQLGREEYLRSLISLSDNGMRVRSPSLQLQEQMEQIGAMVTQQWVADNGAALESVLGF